MVALYTTDDVEADVTRSSENGSTLLAAAAGPAAESSLDQIPFK